MKPGFREETKIEICDRLLSVVESVYRLDLKTKSRDRRFVSARISYSMILRDLNFGYSYIGSVIGKHHSTIIYYCNFFDSYKRSDRIFKEMHEEILYKFQKNDVTIFDIKQLDLESRKSERHILRDNKEVMALNPLRFFSGIKNCFDVTK